MCHNNLNFSDYCLYIYIVKLCVYLYLQSNNFYKDKHIYYYPCLNPVSPFPI